MSRYKDLAKELFFAALEAVRPERMIPASIKRESDRLRIDANIYTLPEKGRLFLLGSGKAVIPMVNAVYPLISDLLKEGVAVSNYSDKLPRKIRLIESCHPYPCKRSVEAAKELTESFERMGKEDFFIYLLSGGSSALIEMPTPPVTLEDFVHTTELLLRYAIPIEEINTVRKHLSQIKGGKLARRTRASGIVLVLSDVVGDDLETIGSAPLYRDSSSREEAIAVLQEAKLWKEVPTSVRRVLSDPACETPKEAKKTIAHHIIGSNRKALEAAKRRAEALGMEARIVTDRMEGDVEEVAVRILKEVADSPAKHRPLVLLFGGEPTVLVRGKGKGGRNQELALRILQKLGNRSGITFLSGATDGIDGNSDAAGGVVDASDYDGAIDRYLEASDSYHYLKKRNALIVTGPTGTNVMDIMIAIKGE